MLILPAACVHNNGKETRDLPKRCGALLRRHAESERACEKESRVLSGIAT